MPKRVPCPNREINNSDCPCEEVECPRHGVCCECVRYHASEKEWPLPACLRIEKKGKNWSVSKTK